MKTNGQEAAPGPLKPAAYDMEPKRPGRAARVFAALGKSACYVGLFMGMQVLVMLPAMVYAAVVAAIAGGSEDEIYDAILSVDVMALTLISGLLTIAVVLAFYLIRRKKLSEALWLRPVSKPALLTGMSLIPALYFVVILVLTALPASVTENYEEASEGIADGSIVTVISVVIVAPVVEEFIFRGLIMTRLSRAMPGWLAVLLSAAVFGMCHGEFVWFCYTFVLGAFFGFIDLRAGSILPSILGHLVFNAIGQTMGFIPDGIGSLIALGVLFAAAIVFPILNRKGIAALFRSRPALPATPVSDAKVEWDLPTVPGTYEFNPWEE